MGIRGRMRALNVLLGIRFGTGAAILPKEIRRIHLDFAYNWNNGNLGPRRFWRECLPRLKYHNPMVSMTVQRRTDQETRPAMTIHFEDNTTKIIDMQNKMPKAIMQEFMTMTNATNVVPSAEEAEELRQVEEERLQSIEDRIQNKKFTDKKKEDKMLLERARQSIS